jgi:hypothetical protein
LDNHPLVRTPPPFEDAGLGDPEPEPDLDSDLDPDPPDPEPESEVRVRDRRSESEIGDPSPRSEIRDPSRRSEFGAFWLASPIAKEPRRRPSESAGNERVEHPDELSQTLCSNAAGGCVRAQHPEEHREHLYAFAQTLCATVAGGCGQAQEPEEHREHPYAFAQTLCTTVAGGCGRAEALSVFGQTLYERAGPLHAIAGRPDEGDEPIAEESRGHHVFGRTPQALPGTALPKAAMLYAHAARLSLVSTTPSAGPRACRL